MARLHLRIRGRVQGVFFRASAVEQARDLGLTGWIRNRHDGSIELVAEGSSDAIAVLRSWCAHGPPGANVRGVDELKAIPTGEFVEFRVRSDA
ncbi:MAG: acylphosphatase [Candidatus Eremiobacteraeota bacterium]|nr:acylphosphatase [Candidatus Eremiobacteraeota bacterium]MBV8366036.1 acylphosphatase [Candidatus Eremiobacteraeota bacterium]